MKLTAAVLLTLIAAAPANAQNWHLEGPLVDGTSAFCLAVSPEDLGIRNNREGNTYDIALFKVPVSNLTLLNLNDLATKDTWALLHVQGIYTAYVKATLGPVQRNDAGTAIVDVFMLSGDYHLYDALKVGTQVRAIIGEGFEFSFDIDTVPGNIMTYSLTGSSSALGWTEDCLTSAPIEDNRG